MSLALLGAPPAFERPLAVGAPVVEPETRERYLALVAQMFDRNWLTNDGPLVRELESEVARLHAVTHCVAVANGTVAQALALRALELSGEVVLPAFSFVATAHACLLEGLAPVFCDIAAETLMAGPEQVERALTNATRAVVAVHLFGNTADAEELAALAERRGVTLLFDAAHAFGCTRGAMPVGSGGSAEILSFHATKAFSTFEGGAVLTNDEGLAGRVRALRNFGFRGYDDVAWLGTNAKLSEAHAALGLASLPALDARWTRSAAIYQAYCRRLADVPGLSVLPVGRAGRSNYHYVPVLVDAQAFGLERDHLYRLLWADNVLARRYFHPGIHRMEAYAAQHAHRSLPVTEGVAGSILCLPSGFEDPVATVDRIVALFLEGRAEARAVRRKLEAAA